MLTQATVQQNNVQYAFDRLMEQLGQQGVSLNATMVSETTKHRAWIIPHYLSVRDIDMLWGFESQARLSDANQAVQDAVGPFKEGIKSFSNEQVTSLCIFHSSAHEIQAPLNL